MFYKWFRNYPIRQQTTSVLAGPWFPGKTVQSRLILSPLDIMDAPFMGENMEHVPSLARNSSSSPIIRKSQKSTPSDSNLAAVQLQGKWGRCLAFFCRAWHTKNKWKGPWCLHAAKERGNKVICSVQGHHSLPASELGIQRAVPASSLSPTPPPVRSRAKYTYQVEEATQAQCT